MRLWRAYASGDRSAPVVLDPYRPVRVVVGRIDKEVADQFSGVGFLEQRAPFGKQFGVELPGALGGVLPALGAPLRWVT